MCSFVWNCGPCAAVDQEDRAVHLRGPRDHVLDVVGVPGAIDVGVVAGLRLVLDVRDGDGDGLRLVADRPALGDVGVALDLGEPAWAWTARMAAVSVVLPWSTCPMVPTFTCVFMLPYLGLPALLSPLRCVPPAIRLQERCWR